MVARVLGRDAEQHRREREVVLVFDGASGLDHCAPAEGVERVRAVARHRLAQERVVVVAREHVVEALDVERPLDASEAAPDRRSVALVSLVVVTDELDALHPLLAVLIDCDVAIEDVLHSAIAFLDLCVLKHCVCPFVWLLVSSLYRL